MRLLRCLSFFGVVGLTCIALGDEPPATIDGPFGEPIRAASETLQAQPNDTTALARRAALYAQAEQPAKAIEDLDRLLKLEPTRADAWDLRGSERFKLGRIDESIADFDQYVKLRPDQEPWHWKRGISYYYAGKYALGRKQFEGYQTVDDADVENAVWRYLCMARDVGVEKAGADLASAERPPGADVADLSVVRRQGDDRRRDDRRPQRIGQSGGIEQSTVLRAPVLGAVRRSSGGRSRSKTPIEGVRGAQDRPLHVERGRRPPAAAECREEIGSRRPARQSHGPLQCRLGWRECGHVAILCRIFQSR